MSEPVAHALANGGSTKDIFVSLAVADGNFDGARLAVHTGTPEAIAMATATDPDSVETLWRGHRLTRTAERAVRVAMGIAADYQLLPMPPGALALGLVAAPDTAASTAMGAGDSAAWTRLAEVIQQDWLGTELENLDLAARWHAAAPEPAAELFPPDVGPRRAQRPRTLVLIALASALLFVAAATAGALAAPDTDRPGPPPHRVVLPDGAIGPGFAVPEDVTRASAPLPHWNETGRKACTWSGRQWAQASGRHQVLIKILRCESFVVAANLHVHVERSVARAATSTEDAVTIPHGIVVRGTEAEGAKLSFTAIVFRRGQYVVHVRAASPPEDAGVGNDRIASDVAHRQWAAVPGTAGAPMPVFDYRADSAKFFGEGVGLASLLLALVSFVAALRVRARRLSARSGRPSDGPDLQWVDVGVEARALNKKAQRRFWMCLILFGVLASMTSTMPWPLALVGYWYLAQQFVLSRRFLPGKHKIWGHHATSQVATGQRPLRTGSLVATSHAIQLAALFSVVIVPITVRLGEIGYILPDGRFNPAIVADSHWLRPLRLVPVPLWVVGTLLLAVGLGMLWDLLYRQARRQAELDALALRKKDPRPPVLYLRNFADDALTIRTSPLTRPTLLEKLGVRQFERFEELIIRYLSVYGPVTAIGDPNATRDAPGVARENVVHQKWKDKVRERIEESRLIVVGATPSASTAGLGWELDAITAAGALDRTVFLLAPRPTDTIGRHWRRFRAMAFFRVPERITPFADRTLAVHRAPTGEWTAIHAAERTDWAYALAMSRLADAILDHAAQDRPVDAEAAGSTR